MPDTQKKKICMIGEFAVGKTSLTQKFVNNIFSDKYLTTVGVKIDTAFVGDTKLVVWDIAGRDSISPINLNYLVGSAGVVIVVDGTRKETQASVEELLSVVQQRIGKVPCVVALNKCDASDWEASDELLRDLQKAGIELIKTSAKEGENVDLLFSTLVDLFE